MKLVNLHIDKWELTLSNDIKVFGHTYLFAMLLLIGLARFLHPRCFCFAVLLLAAMTYNQVQSLRINHQRISFSR